LIIAMLASVTPSCLVFEERPPCYEPDDCADDEECVDNACRAAEGEGEGE
jgi:hypothetical protein